MTRQEVVSKVSKETKIDKIIVRKVLDATLDSMKDALANDDGVYFRGFGSFTKKLSNRTTARDIMNNKTITIPQVNRVKFKESQELKDALNN